MKNDKTSFKISRIIITKPSSNSVTYEDCFRDSSKLAILDDFSTSEAFENFFDLKEVVLSDGGKYTTNCSRNCYDEVYNKNKMFVKNSSVNLMSDIKKLHSNNVIALDNYCNFYGYYYTEQDQSTGNNTIFGRIARWYKTSR